MEDGTLKNLKQSTNSPKFKFYKLDLCNLKKIEKLFKKIDCVYHLAAYSDIVPSINQPRDYMYNNIVSTLNILSCIKKYNVKKIIYAASSSCYGIPKKYPTKENEKIDCKYPYSKSKNSCEDIIIHWSKVYRFKFISLRLFNVYGTRSRTNSAYGAALGVFLKQKLSNQPFTIVGTGNQKRDFIYVSDVCEAFYKSSILKISNKILNIGSGKPHSVNFLVSLIGGKKVFVKKRPGEPFITHANISKAKKNLNWEPNITLKKGIKIVMDNISYWKNAPLWNKKKIEKATKQWFRYL